MKNKFIASTLAAAALAVGGAASAQDLGIVIGNAFGAGPPAYTYPGYATPAVVAGAGQTVYQDQYGRRFYYDQYGRQVTLQTAPQQIVGYDQWGRPVYGGTQFTYNTYTYPQYNDRRRWDRDGDGVADSRDRWPNDRRHW